MSCCSIRLDPRPCQRGCRHLCQSTGSTILACGAACRPMRRLDTSFESSAHSRPGALDPAPPGAVTRDAFSKSLSPPVCPCCRACVSSCSWQRMHAPLRAKCRRCGKPIQKGHLRIGFPMHDARGDEGAVTGWNHLNCSRLSLAECPSMDDTWVSGW